MKTIIVSIISFLFCQIALGQTKMITAKDAYKYVNQTITVKDDIYASKVYRDSLAVMELGKPGNEHPFSIILIKKANGPALDEKVINTLKLAKASFTGLIVSNASGILMIVDTSDKIRFNYKLD